MDHIHTIMVLDGNIIQDPVLIEAMKLLFKWANEQGLAGLKADKLEFKEVVTPMGNKLYADCKISK